MLCYTFRAATYCPDCIIPELIDTKVIPRGHRECTISEVFDIYWITHDIYDERDYDSWHFAKGPFPSEKDDYCDRCRCRLYDEER